MELAEGEIEKVEAALLEEIRSAGSEEGIRNMEVPLSGIRDSLAVGILNIHLLGRAQVWTDVQEDRAQTRLMGRIVTETEFEPLPFDEAIDFFRDKVNLTPAQFAQLSERARTKAFTIADGATLQVRESIKGMLERSLAEGVTLREFQAQAEDVLDRAGISARTPWYWETVYRTNLQTSYQVGRWKQMTDPAVVAARPFLRYVSARLPTSRPSHVANHGQIFPADHSFWNEWYPPNGFNCYCSTTSVSQSLLDRRKWRVSARSPNRQADEGFRINAGRAEEV